MTKKKRAKPDLAIHRAEVIMKVRCGLMTATQAAKQLGVSRKTYYKWEKRGLASMLEGLKDTLSGRPPKPEIAKQEEAANKQIDLLMQEKEILSKKLALKTIIQDMEGQQDRRKKK